MIKQMVLDILDFLRKQVAEDKCTLEEMQSIHDTLISNIKIDATIGDIAEHYGQSQSNVRNAIARGYIGKPKRRVFYHLPKFMECMPKSWKRNKQTTEKQCG